MSKKYSKSKIEKILRFVEFYAKKFEQTGNNEDKLRYEFLLDKYKEVICLNDINFFSESFKKTNSSADLKRWYFSAVRYYEALLEKTHSSRAKCLCEKAKENYESVFPVGDIFSMNRKA